MDVASVSQKGKVVGQLTRVSEEMAQASRLDQDLLAKRLEREAVENTLNRVGRHFNHIV